MSVYNQLHFAIWSRIAGHKIHALEGEKKKNNQLEGHKLSNVTFSLSIPLRRLQCMFGRDFHRYLELQYIRKRADIIKDRKRLPGTEGSTRGKVCGACEADRE